MGGVSVAWSQVKAEGELFEQPFVCLLREEGRPEAELSGAVFKVDRNPGCDARGRKRSAEGERIELSVISNTLSTTAVVYC